jgi:hypothetical protein
MPLPRRIPLAAAIALGMAATSLSLSPATAQTPEDATDTVVGELVRLAVEPSEGLTGPSRQGATQMWIEPEAGEAVRVAADDVDDLEIGATVEATLGGVAPEEDGQAGTEPVREVLAAETLAPPVQPDVAAATPPFTNEVTVALVVPPGATQDGTTLAQVVSLVNGPIADFWEDETGGQITVGVTAQHNWRTVTTSCEQPVELLDEVATAVGFTDGPGKHLMVYLPGHWSMLQNCAEVAAEWATAPEDGGRFFVKGARERLTAHGLGHNFGLADSDRLTCGSTSCTWVMHGDPYDVMGRSDGGLGSLHAMHAAQLGVLPPEQVFTFDYSDRGGFVTLSPISGRTGIRAVRLVDSEGYEYWVEYRSATGRDAWYVNDYSLAQPGVVIRSDELWPEASLLVPERTFAGGEFTVSIDYSKVSVDHTSGNPVIRVATHASDPFPRDWTGEDYADLVTVDGSGNLLLYPGNGTGGFWARRVLGRGWQGRDLITMVGDWNGDGRPDMVARDPATGDLWLYRGNDAGGFLGWGVIGRGWNTVTDLFSPGDFDGDGHADLVARVKAYGQLVLYSGNGRGGFRGAPQGLGQFGVMKYFGAGWTGFRLAS